MTEHIAARTCVGRLWVLVWVLALTGFLSFACGSSANQTTPSATGKVSPAPPHAKGSSPPRSDIGFASQQKLKDHYKKHGPGFGSISMQEYLRQAQELRDIPTGGEVLEMVRPDGVTSRFDRSKGSFVAFNRDGVIRTFFRPNDGEAYFWRQSRRKH